MSGPQQALGAYEELLPTYYDCLFPYKQMFQWLSYGTADEGIAMDKTESQTFPRREFSFTLKDDIYIRYQSFEVARARMQASADAAADGDEVMTERSDDYVKPWDNLKKALRDKCPHKIDIGAVFTAPPKDKNSYTPATFTPVQKELVFDIDMTDYDEIRTCCDGAKVCSKCWGFMTVAIKVVDRALREDFGFEHLLWVFSGRRGVHCWVCDHRARMMPNEVRSAVAENLHVVKGNENTARKVILTTPVHPSLHHAYKDVLRPMFEELILKNQELLVHEAKAKGVLDMVIDTGTRAKISDEWKRIDSKAKLDDGYARSKAKWEVMRSHLAGQGEQNEKEIVFALMYPRLDINVSKQLNHLLKSPFCVHPKTGKVCVPMDPQTCERFDLDAVPTMNSLVQQIAEMKIDLRLLKGSSDESKTARKAVKNTSLKEYVTLFEASFLRPLQQSIRLQRRKRKQDGDQSW